MNVDIVKKILEESAEINAETNQKVKVLFHGGEPLLWGIERFYEIYEYEKELSDKTGVKFTNSIQTNASLIDDEWIRFFKTSHTYWHWDKFGWTDWCKRTFFSG